MSTLSEPLNAPLARRTIEPADARPTDGLHRLELVGAGLRVPLLPDGTAEYANFDHAASTPALRAVRDAVDEVLPYYASVHRGAGYHSRVTTRLYEQARTAVTAAVRAREDDVVLFTRNTTDSMNLLARCLPARTTVVVFASEHHASLLPWQGRVVRLAVPDTPEAAVAAADEALTALPRGPKLLCVTAASNVTGELWPVADLVETAHRHGARAAVDAAQFVPHRQLDVAAWDADYVAFSGHKLYAPYGAGVLLGRADWLAAAEPYLRGGGATARVGTAGIEWAELPDRQEAGSPNVLGAVAIGAACHVLSGAARAAAHDREAALLSRLRTGLRAVPGLTELHTFDPAHERVGITSFTVEGQDGGLLAAALSAEYGIGVRDGRFCAHPLVDHLLARAGNADAASGDGCDAPAIRASVGLGTTSEHVERLIAAVAELAAHGPRWSYSDVDGKSEPVPDPRPLPDFTTGPWLG